MDFRNRIHSRDPALNTVNKVKAILFWFNVLLVIVWSSSPVSPWSWFYLVLLSCWSHKPPFMIVLQILWKCSCHPRFQHTGNSYVLVSLSLALTFCNTPWNPNVSANCVVRANIVKAAGARIETSPSMWFIKEYETWGGIIRVSYDEMVEAEKGELLKLKVWESS